MVAATSKKTWKLSAEQLVTRREMLGRELDEVAKKRDALRSTSLRLAEVKELIKATELGQEQEELKASQKDLELILESLHTNVERLSREVLTGETSEPQDSLPGVDAPKGKARPPKASAAERTLAIPGTGEPAPLALPPGPAHPDAVDGEIIDEEAERAARAAHNLRESWRSLVLRSLEVGDFDGLLLQDLVESGCAEAAIRAPSPSELKELLATMVRSGAISYEPEQGIYLSPLPPPGSANVQRAILRLLPADPDRWEHHELLVEKVLKEFPIGALPLREQIEECLRALVMGEKVCVRSFGDDPACWYQAIPEPPAKRRGKGKAKASAKKARKGAKGKASRASGEAASLAAYEAEGEALASGKGAEG